MAPLLVMFANPDMAGHRLSVWKPEEMLRQIANPFQLNIDISMQYFKSCFLLQEYANVHTETPDETLLVSNSETRDFSSWQGNQGVARRRTSVRRTSKPED
ncbi:MAG: hypothetical protein ABSA06_01450 [Geobacteraceae bacterium]|jgi:hypothetical protein